MSTRSLYPPFPTNSWFFFFIFSGNLYYILTSRPKRGHLENIKAKRYVRRRFTQKDLDDESLLYIVDSKADSYADTFSFRIEDSRGNVLRDQQ